MNKIELANGVFHYVFAPSEGRIISDTLVAIIDGNRALLIDVGYVEEIKLVIDDLTKNGINIETVIISHFHSDHYFGMQELQNVPTYGGAGFEETFISEGYDEEHIKEAAPKFVVDKPTTIEFGAHKLEMIPMVGHSVCTLLVKINDEFLFVADDILTSIDGQLTVPWLCGKGNRDELINKQLGAWEALRQYADYKIIPAHGPAFDGSELIKYLDNLTTYLSAIQKANGKISYEDAIKDCCHPPIDVPFRKNSSFKEKSWHEHNCKDR
ncbi:MAG: MBL fold metallo-hydrolase [Defluviitaleaceae bacterium]|nr:MBL fold metallo-hydrolase [Defluviitaleaceae bacterium]